MTLLIVDDEKGIRYVIKEYAKLDGYKVLEAEDGEKALDVLYNNDIDLVVLDIMMPHMDGMTAYKET